MKMKFYRTVILMAAISSFSSSGFSQLRKLNSHQSAQALKLEQFNEQFTRSLKSNIETDQNAIDHSESGGDTDQIINQQDNGIDQSEVEQQDVLNNDILDISEDLGESSLQDYVISKTKGKRSGTWAAHFVFIGNDGQRTVLSSLNQNISIKPASTLKLFTGYLAFLEESYPLTSLSVMLHKSDNIMANQALRSVAVKEGVQADGENKSQVLLDAGVQIMVEHYKNLENSSKFHPVNGSGLNTTGKDEGDELNKTTVRTETNLLETIITDGNYDVFKKLLAQPGQFGTLNRHLAPVKKLGGKVYAKTGTLARTKGLAGYVEMDSGVLVFSIIADELKIKPVAAFNIIEQIVIKHTQWVRSQQ